MTAADDLAGQLSKVQLPAFSETTSSEHLIAANLGAGVLSKTDGSPEVPSSTEVEETSATLAVGLLSNTHWASSARRSSAEQLVSARDKAGSVGRRLCAPRHGGRAPLGLRLEYRYLLLVGNLARRKALRVRARVHRYTFILLNTMLSRAFLLCCAMIARIFACDTSARLVRISARDPFTSSTSSPHLLCSQRQSSCCF